MKAKNYFARISMIGNIICFTLVAICGLCDGGNFPLNQNSCLCSTWLISESYMQPRTLFFHAVLYGVFSMHIPSWRQTLMILTIVFLSFLTITKENRLGTMLCRWDVRQEGTVKSQLLSKTYFANFGFWWLYDEKILIYLFKCLNQPFHIGINGIDINKVNWLLG